MSQRSAKMNRRMDAYDDRLQNLENRWDIAVSNTSAELASIERKYDRMRSERTREASRRQKWGRVNRVLVTILLSLSAAVVAVCLFDMLHPDPADPVELPKATDTVIVQKMNDLGTAEFCSNGYLQPVFYDCGLSLDLQEDLREACEESGVDMALALSVIQQETNFQNIVGDNGNSYGYMQVQPRWHQERMDRLGVTDLMDPASNFRVGCDYLAECLDRYPMASALSAYNSGRPDLVPYAEQVIDIYDGMWGRVI